jgi:hypothetical protein
MGNCLSVLSSTLCKKKEKKRIPGNVICCCNKGDGVEIIYDEICVKDIII